MADYNKLTVANLRQLLKDRGIPSTGLTRKAQIVERLQEQDRANDEVKGDAKEQEDVPDAEDLGRAASQRQDNDGQTEEQVTAQPAHTGEDVEVAGECRFDALGMCETDREVQVHPQNPRLAEQDPEPQVAPMEKEAEPSTVVEEATAEIDADADEDQSMDTESSAEPVAEEAPAPAPAVEELPTPTTAQAAEKIATQQFEPPTPDVAMEEPRTASPDLCEKPSVEKPELLPIPERSVNPSVEASRLNTEEAEADTRKRKRRSGSPELPPQDVKAKKSRPSEESVPDVVMDHGVSGQNEQGAPQHQGAEASWAAQETKHMISESILSAPDTTEAPATDITVSDSKAPAEPKSKATRYKDLFSPTDPAPAPDMPLSSLPKSGALHPATPALYIRDLMRPLRPDALRSHIATLAAPPSSGPNPEAIKTLFLDNMRTHAFVLFTSANAASRVRAAMHGTIWPPEGNRKQLFVDFVPAEKVESWIGQEEDAIVAEKEARAAGRSMNAKRFEVVYEQCSDGIEAIFQELGAGAPVNAPKGPKGLTDRRPSSYDDFATTYAPPVTAAPPQATTSTIKPSQSSFQTLDSLFLSTSSSKPLLYFKEVSPDVAAARKRALEAEASRDWDPDARVRGRGRGRLDEKCKFGFDREGELIEVGVDHGPWSERRLDGRGGRGGWGGGDRGGRGGWRGRGGGDRW
ncbi:hypothetical protein P154DRAFT_432546 [Amniculicola lignicola CBS 123094]|uniref:SAP domain-containing protein n=1 Tax=Amniculicola lignicola CBS 123094 TaxID=1392246 RepID=A0A6A5WIX7_9PLEO|nr:hypothetical protein P154DRAFT_432546 [Amniculicola lignicola CBS 123094]